MKRYLGSDMQDYEERERRKLEQQRASGKKKPRGNGDARAALQRGQSTTRGNARGR
jgi:hypothetical protein